MAQIQLNRQTEKKWPKSQTEITLIKQIINKRWETILGHTDNMFNKTEFGNLE